MEMEKVSVGMAKVSIQIFEQIMEVKRTVGPAEVKQLLTNQKNNRSNFKALRF